MGPSSCCQSDRQADMTQNITFLQIRWSSVISTNCADKKRSSHCVPFFQVFWSINTHKRSYRKVMFLRMSVHHSVHMEVSMWPLPNMHFNIEPNPLPLPTAPPRGHQTWYLPAHPIGHHTWGILSALLLTSGGHHLRPIQTWSLEALFNLLHWQWHLVVTTKTRTVGKSTVGILLECCLVAGSLEAAYSLNWGAQKIWGKGGEKTLALLW